MEEIVLSTATVTRESTRLLDTYGIHKKMPWVKRETYQDLIDGARAMEHDDPYNAIVVSHNLDGKEDTQEGVVALRSPSCYSVDYLLYLGATTKSGVSGQIGEKGEGIKLATLLLMRDFGIQVVRESSNGNTHWTAAAVWETVNLGVTQARGLCWDITTKVAVTDEVFSQITLTGPASQLREFLAIDAAAFFAGPHNQHLLHSIGGGVYAKTSPEAPGRIFLAGLDRGEDPRLLFIYKVDQKLPEDNDRDRETLSTEAAASAIHSLLKTGNVPDVVIERIFSERMADFVKGYPDFPETKALKRLDNYADLWIEQVQGYLHSFSYSEENYYRSWDTEELTRFGLRQVTDYTLVQALKKREIKSLEAHRDQVQKTREVVVADDSRYDRKVKLLKSALRDGGIDDAPEIVIFEPENDKERETLGFYALDGQVRLAVDLFDQHPFAKALEVYIAKYCRRFADYDTKRYADKVVEVFGMVLGVGSDDPASKLDTLARSSRAWRGRKRKTAIVVKPTQNASADGTDLP